MIRTLSKKLSGRLRALHRDEQGADMVEYILIVAAVALPLLAVIIWFRGELTDWFKGLWGQTRGEVGDELDFDSP